MRTPNGADVIAGLTLGLLLGWGTAGHPAKKHDLRAIDVVALGPWLVGLAARGRPLSRWQRFLLAVAGGATIAHNGRNMLAARDQLSESQT